MVQMFHGPTGDVAGRDVINNEHGQRVNNHVNVHVHVDSVSQEADTAAAKALFREITRLIPTTDKLWPKVVGYARTNFNSPILINLTVEQLHQVYSYVEGLLEGVKLGDEASKHSQAIKEGTEYKEFLSETGIRASRIERDELTRLVNEHRVTFPTAKIVWEDRSLTYCDLENRLKVTVPKYLPAFAIFALGGAGIVMAPFVFSFLLGKLPLLQNMILFAVIASVFAFAIWFGVNLLQPYFIAKRIAPYVASMYGKPS